MLRNIVFVALVLTALCFAPVAHGAVVNVNIVDFTFNPDSAIVNENDSVVWHNTGAAPHTSTSGTNGSPDGLWNSGTISPGTSWGRKFTETGSHEYYCQFHYQSSGMRGWIVVRPAAIGDPGPGGRETGMGIGAWPSPFLGRVEITYEVETPGVTTLRIYSGSGRVVRILAAGLAAPGRHSVTWDGRSSEGVDVPTGVYLGELRTAQRVSLVRLLKL